VGELLQKLSLPFDKRKSGFGLQIRFFRCGLEIKHPS
jgi:hypothetical protein